jgi:hypothetical protein
VEDSRELSGLMGYFLSKPAREVGRLTGWKEKIFGRRYQAIVVSDEVAFEVPPDSRRALRRHCSETLKRPATPPRKPKRF